MNITIEAAFKPGDLIVQKFHKHVRKVLSITQGEHDAYYTTVLVDNPNGVRAGTDQIAVSDAAERYFLKPAAPDVVYTITLKQHGHTSNQNVTAPEVAAEAAQRLLDSLPGRCGTPSIEWELNIESKHGRGLSPSQPSSGTVS